MTHNRRLVRLFLVYTISHKIIVVYCQTFHNVQVYHYTFLKRVKYVIICLNHITILYEQFNKLDYCIYCIIFKQFVNGLILTKNPQNRFN